uniref:Uncharacterized protein n=1 Tax=Rhizophora mucronata TaxID=61149 RepID=A0A2P2MXH0_RHIMU
MRRVIAFSSSAAGSGGSEAAFAASNLSDACNQ